jgi:hypothetical protein
MLWKCKCGNDGSIFRTPHFHKLTMNSLSVPLIHRRNDLVRLIIQIESIISSLYVVNKLHDRKLHKECMNDLLDHEIFYFLRYEIPWCRKCVTRAMHMLNTWEKFHAKLFWHVRRKKFFSRYILSGFHCILLAPLCSIILKTNTSRKTVVGN